MTQKARREQKTWGGKKGFRFWEQSHLELKGENLIRKIKEL